jgi:hypothetical protein
MKQEREDEYNQIISDMTTQRGINFVAILMKEMRTERDALKASLEIATKALAWYADPSNHASSGGFAHDGCDTPVNHDTGVRAFVALETALEHIARGLGQGRPCCLESHELRLEAGHHSEIAYEAFAEITDTKPPTK